mgnify:CR=1 FL=1
MNTKLQSLKKYIENNTKETINLINEKAKENIESLNNIELIEQNKLFNGIKLLTNKSTVLVTICNKQDADDLVYKYWTYFCIQNKNEQNIGLLDTIDMKAYSYEKHHDIMELSNEEKQINIKIHYISTEELLKKELINQDELLVLIV